MKGPPRLLAYVSATARINSSGRIRRGYYTDLYAPARSPGVQSAHDTTFGGCRLSGRFNPDLRQIGRARAEGPRQPGAPYSYLSATRRSPRHARGTRPARGFHRQGAFRQSHADAAASGAL